MKNLLKKILQNPAKKILFSAVFALTLFAALNLSADAAVCNSPCPDPCAPSQTVCEGTNCTTYCAKSPIYNTTYYTTPGVSFSYSTPNVSFSISNEVYGIYNYYSRPNFTITNGFRPVYHRIPVRPVYSAHKPVHVAKNPPKPVPAVNKKPAQNINPAPRPMPAANKKPKK